MYSIYKNFVLLYVFGSLVSLPGEFRVVSLMKSDL